MSKLDLINKSFEPSENPGLNTLDPRFQEIASLVESDDFSKVSIQAESLFNESVYDIRIIGYFLNAVFMEEGMASLETMFQCLARLFQENWEAVGPAQKKEKHTQKAFLWLFSKLNDHLNYHQQQNDEKWRQWVETISHEQANGILNAHREFQQVFSALFQDDVVLEQMTKLLQWIDEFCKIVSPPEPEPEAVYEQEVRQGEPGEGFPQPSSPQSFSGMAIEASYPLQCLIKKIEAFGILTEKGDFLKASIVADDINNIVSNFDPRVYFPKTFATYYRQLSECVESVAQHWEMKETLGWQTLTQFYNVDLDRFVQ